MSSTAVRLLLGMALGAISLAGAGSAHARSFETLYRFTGRGDGAGPVGDLVLQNGMLYGVAQGGGRNTGTGSCPTLGCGTVFKLDPATGTLTTLHTFTGDPDGATPEGGLVFDSAGAIYGTTVGGGMTVSGCCGTVFKLDPTTQSLTVLHTFSGGDGSMPFATLVLNGGKLYGMTSLGGASGAGTVFALDPVTQTLTTLHSFCALPKCADGSRPSGELVFDTAGMLYGLTSGGGSARGAAGTLFEFDPSTHALATLHSFSDGSLGAYPAAGLVIKNNTLYGTTVGGRIGHGTIFRFNLATRNFQSLYSFSGGADGGRPSSLTEDLAAHSGLLYGTTFDPNVGDLGTVFKFNSGPRTLTNLHSFTGGRDGAEPAGGLVLDTTGALYGTTLRDGHSTGSCCGTIFKLVP